MSGETLILRRRWRRSYLYEEVDLIREFGESDFMEKTAIISYDEKPGVQAIANTAPDLPPVPGIHSCTSRDHENKRQGTVSLLAGIDLLTGYVHGRVEDRHRSKEFVDFLKDLDRFYSDKDKIKVLLDNHSAHISKETRGYLATVPNRFEFTFTPKHGSWLNIIECFFSKMSNFSIKGGTLPPFAMRSEFAWLIPRGRARCVLRKYVLIIPTIFILPRIIEKLPK